MEPKVKTKWTPSKLGKLLSIDSQQAKMLLRMAPAKHNRSMDDIMCEVHHFGESVLSNKFLRTGGKSFVIYVVLGQDATLDLMFISNDDSADLDLSVTFENEQLLREFLDEFFWSKLKPKS